MRNIRPMEKQLIRTKITKIGTMIPRYLCAVGALLLFTAQVQAQATSPTPAGYSPAGPSTNSQNGAVGTASQAPQPAGQAGTTAEAERVIVTGSNIPTAEEVGPNPVLNINRDLINKSGERSAEALLKKPARRQC